MICQCSRRARSSWSATTSDEERKAACHKMADILEANAGELAVLLTNLLILSQRVITTLRSRRTW